MQGEQHPVYAASLSNLAALYSRMGNYPRAEPLTKEALAIRRSALGAKHRYCGDSLHNLALLYCNMGDYGRAELLHKEAREIFKSVIGERHPTYATSLDGFAAVYLNRRDYARAEPLFKQALTIRKSVLSEHHPDYVSSLSNLGMLYTRMGDFARAEPLYKQALELRKSVPGEKHPLYADSLNNLGMLYTDMRYYTRAEPLYQNALTIRKSLLGKQHPQYADSLNNLGMLYELTEDYVHAEPLYKQARDIRESVLGTQHPSYASSLNNLARLYQNMGNYVRAEPLYKQARDIRESVLGKQHPSYAFSLNNLAGLYRSMEDYPRADPLYKQAMDIQRDHLDGNATVQSARQQRLNQSKHGFLDSRLSNSISMTSADAVRVATDMWQWKGAVTARQQAYRRVAGNPKLSPLFTELQSVTQQLSVASGQIPIPPAKSASETKRNAFRQKREIWEKRVAGLSRHREDLEQQIAAGSEEFRRITEPLTTEAVQSGLPKDAAFIDFLEYQHSSPDPKKKGKTNYEQRYLVVVVPHDGPVTLVGLGSSEAISAAITSFRRPLAGQPRSQQEATAAAQKLRELLWLPVEKHLAGINTVIISPDTALGTLPFAALPGKADGSYLIEQYRFASLPMAGMMRSLFDEDQERTQPEKGLLVLGDVNYNANSLVAQAEPKQNSRVAAIRRSAPRGGPGKWQSLPGFQQELVTVRDQFKSKFNGGVTTLRKNNATEAEFIKQASRHNNLHLITHGYFADPKFEAIGSSSDNDESRASPTTRTSLARNKTVNQYLPGLLSGIVLSGANNPPPVDDPKADGILTASEIETLDLNGVNLVVLSACETGLGKSAGGEGLTGLQRAFHIAGVRSCIASLWEVEDKATLEIMSRFYKYYWHDGQSKIDALRNAQLDILRDPSLTRGDLTRGTISKLKKPTGNTQASERTNPKYWAAFQLSGDWR